MSFRYNSLPERASEVTASLQQNLLTESLSKGRYGRRVGRQVDWPFTGGKYG